MASRADWSCRDCPPESDSSAPPSGSSRSPEACRLDSHCPMLPQERASPGHSRLLPQALPRTCTPANPQRPAISSPTGPQGAQTVAVTAGPWRGEGTPWLPLGSRCPLLALVSSARPFPVCPAHPASIANWALRFHPFSRLMTLLPLICVREHLDQAPPYGA